MPSVPQSRSNSGRTSSPSIKTTATYSNKDGSKFITIPKSPRSPQPESDVSTPEGPRPTPRVSSPTEALQDNSEAQQAHNAGGTKVNRKKQKRRQKQAARLAAEQSMTSPDRLRDISNSGSDGAHISQDLDDREQDLDDPDQFQAGDGEDLYYSEDDGHDQYAGANGHPQDQPSMGTTKSKKSRKKKNKSASTQAAHSAIPGSGETLLPPPPPPPAPLSTKGSQSRSKDRIWNTSTQEERERIKDFWLSLGEEERRSLVKVEKEAVLRKMKEQQKHSCSCTVCGRKRTAIEEELEVLYDAYYEELEQYANHQQVRLEDGASMMPPPRRLTHPMSRPPSNVPPLTGGTQSRGRIEELAEDDEIEEDDYSDEDEDDEDEDYSDEDLEDEPRGPAADFFNFGNSLTVQGGILTVADDLLKNDGKKFIEMMEQLAERRMQREEEAHYAAIGHPSMGMQGHVHNHPDDDEYDDEDDEDFDSQDEDEYDEDETDLMTEEQRMEEGRRMFQIFAARMFEQRVLTAYREKVAQERQKKLLEELEEESRLDVQREAKKAKEAQKKKDKKRLQKQAKEEEKARKEAEKAAEEAAARAKEEKRQEELRLKKEEQRKKKEAEKKAQEEERLKKELEKQKRLQEERERQAEVERKHREQKEREKKKRDDAKRKEREDREAKEREAKEKKEREEKERMGAGARVSTENDTKERLNKEEPVPVPTAPSSQASKRPSHPSAVPTPLAHAQVHATTGFQSPHLPIATPALPKAPTPVKPRQPSQQGSHSSSPLTPNVKPIGSQSVSPSNSVPIQENRSTITASTQQSPSSLPRTISSVSPGNASTTGLHGPPGAGLSGMGPFGLSGFPPQGAMLPGMSQRAPIGQEMPLYPHPPAPIGAQYRGFPSASGIQSLANGTRPVAQNRGFGIDAAPGLPPHMPNSHGGPPGGLGYPVSREPIPTHSHSRNQSASYEKSPFDSSMTLPQTQPIARPLPIQRPSAEENNQPSRSHVDELSSHLGSSALLDDSDEPFFPESMDNRRSSMAPGAGRSSRLGYGASPFLPETIFRGKPDTFNPPGHATGGNAWGPPSVPFGTPGLPSNSAWPSGSGAGWSHNNAFGIIGGPSRSVIPRPVSVRLLTCQACKQLSGAKGEDGFHEVNTVLRQVEQVKSKNEPPIQLKEIMEIFETEGDAHNGGGFFNVRVDGQGRTFVKFESGGGAPIGGRGMSAGEIGSPIPGSTMPTFGGPRSFQSTGLSSPSGF